VSSRRWVLRVGAGAAAIGGVGVLCARGALTLDLGVGRRTRRLGPIELRIAAPPEMVFDVIEGPYRRTPRAMAGKLRVWERGADMVLAEHFAKIGPLRASTLEVVRFERPERITFRLVRGPVPHVVESYELRELDGETRFVYSGELGADFWRLGDLVASRAAPLWERAVADSLDLVVREAERRASGRRAASR
jgi:Polyketide cyclase / dehydrase and lipid transport